MENSAVNKSDSVDSIAYTENKYANEKIGEIIHSFSEETKIGVPTKNKIEILEIAQPEFNEAKINFYALSDQKNWQLIQTCSFEIAKATGLRTFVKDYNGDGLNDFAYEYALAGRGANQLQRLFIYDKVKKELVFVKDSEKYPNLKYNKRTKSLTAQRFYGGTTLTEFLRLENNSLKLFASVESSGNVRSVFVIDEKGEKKLLRKYKIKGFEYLERFKNYNPLEFDVEW